MNKSIFSKVTSIGLTVALCASFSSSLANLHEVGATTAENTQKTLDNTSPETLNNPNLQQNGYQVDPYEKFNRGVFEFNKVFLGLFVEPIAYIYSNGVWSPVQRGVSNVYNNISTVTTLPNDLLQGKVKYFFNDFWRLIINSTIGIGGIFDVAKHMGLKPHQTDFGMTLATWGAKRSKFIMLPILGPSTFRDGFAIPFNVYMSPYPYFNKSGTVWALLGGKQLDLQARLMPAYKLMRDAFDPYVFIRNGYMQARNSQIRRNSLPLSQASYFDPTESGIGGNIFTDPVANESGMITADGSSTTPVPTSTPKGNGGTTAASHTKVSHKVSKDVPTAAAGAKTGHTA
ncbi:MAG: VacJ family lipoprotein [Coxiellaceae bacterium]|nr:VacJ family lipoprotein [Coxiellaceae bacterium]